MNELCLEVFSNVSQQGLCVVPLETFVVIFLYEYCSEPTMLITLIRSTALNNRAHFKIKLPKILFEFINEYDADVPANLCKLPLLITKNNSTCISGLSSVLRHLLQIVEPRHPFLGFKQGCLNACPEASIWTKFCEVDIINTVNQMFLKEDYMVETVMLPEDVARFEIHMSKPVKVHNIQKEKQDLARREGYFSNNRSRTPDARLDIIKDLEHKFAEGHKMCLADLILFPCFYLIFNFFGTKEIKGHIPYTYKWFESVKEDPKVMVSMKFVGDFMKLPECIKYALPFVSDVSMYKSEKKKLRKQLLTNQYVIDNSLEMIYNVEKHMEISSRVFGYDQSFSWSLVPLELQLVGRGFPKERLERKVQQLENVIKAVMKLAKKGDRIVDFCAGSGYLGLILAHCLPACTIILVENKEESLRTAQELAVSFKIPNVIFCQGNIDYFLGHFNIGVSLHACGIATDIVIEKCLYKKASFVCCPCCYGFIEPNHIIKYPRSKVFKDSQLTILDYFTLAHGADQNDDDKSTRASHGKKCMNIIDGDRCLRAKEYGYNAYLSTLEPPTCTPKNNLLVGIPK